MASAASELRDSADATRDPAVYSVFLNTLIPPITAMLLETGPPVVFFREQPEQVSPYHIPTLSGVILTEIHHDAALPKHVISIPAKIAAH